MDDETERFLRRRRRKYFDCDSENQRINRNRIRDFLEGSYLERFCQSIGLKVKEIRLIAIEPENQETDHPTKVIVNEILSNDYKIEQLLIAKDLTNMSRRKFRLWRQILKKIFFDKIPNWRDVEEKQHEINNIFPLISNQKGFFLDPNQKIKYVCQKFLERNEEFVENDERNFKIKLSADGVTISKKNIKLLNFTFSLINDEFNCMGVYHTYILGKYFF